MAKRNSPKAGNKAPDFTADLPPSLHAERRGEIAILRLARPQKRNALDDVLILGMERFFMTLPDGIKAVVLHGEGEHFSAGLDLSSLAEASVAEGVQRGEADGRLALAGVTKEKDF